MSQDVVSLTFKLIHSNVLALYQDLSCCIMIDTPPPEKDGTWTKGKSTPVQNFQIRLDDISKYFA